MKKQILSFIFGSLLILSACGGANSDSNSKQGQSVDTSKAEAIYKENCATCHGDDLSGDIGPDLTSIGNKLSKKQIKTQIKKGGNGMIPNLVSGDDLDTISAWLAEQK